MNMAHYPRNITPDQFTKTDNLAGSYRSIGTTEAIIGTGALTMFDRY